MVHKKIQHKEINDLDYRIKDNQWTTWILVCNRGGKNIAIASYYRSTSGDGNANDLTKEIKEIQTKYQIKSHMVSGHFNAYSGLWDARFKEKQDRIADNVITSPTLHQFALCPINIKVE